MPDNPPLSAAGAREPEKRPRPIPRAVRDAINLMVFGKMDDADCAPLDFIEAAKLSGIKPDVMRRYLDRPSVRALLRAERRAFRDAICAGNELALRKVRDQSRNGMASIAAVRALEQLDEQDHGRPGDSDKQMPGLTIIIEQPQHPAPVTTIDVTPHGRNTDAARQPQSNAHSVGHSGDA